MTDSTATLDAPPAGTTRRRWRIRWPSRNAWIAIALGLVVTLPILYVGALAVNQRWFPSGDWAMIELNVRSTGTANTPLVGPYSRYGWNHPGPLLFWLYAIPYRLSGGRSVSLLAGAALVNVASVAGMLAFTWRRGRLALTALLTIAVGLLLAAIGPMILRDPWNPWITMLPFGVLVLASWSAVEGDRVGLVLAPFVGSFLVESHIGFAPIVAGLLGWAAIGSWRRVRDGRGLAIAGAVLAACWAPVVVDLALGGDNLSRIWQHFASDQGPVAGLGKGIGVAARELVFRGPWTGTVEPMTDGGAVIGRSAVNLVVPMLAFGGALVLALRHRARDAVRFQLTVAIAAVIAVLAVSRITDDVLAYLVRWWWPLAALWWVSIVWSLWTVVVARRHDVKGALVWPLVGAAVLSGAFDLFTMVRDPNNDSLPADQWSSTIESAAAQTLLHVSPGEPVLIEGAGYWSGWAKDGLTLQLTKAGVPVVVPDRGINRTKFGNRTTDTASADANLFVATDEYIAQLQADPRWSLIAYVDPDTVAGKSPRVALAVFRADPGVSPPTPST